MVYVRHKGKFYKLRKDGKIKVGNHLVKPRRGNKRYASNPNQKSKRKSRRRRSTRKGMKRKTARRAYMRGPHWMSGTAMY